MIVAFIFLVPLESAYDFEGLFTIDLPMGQKYYNPDWCHDYGGLGSRTNYWQEGAGCEIDGDEVVLFYYNSSVTGDYDISTADYAVTVLNRTYFYNYLGVDDGLMIMESDLGMSKVPQYMAGKASDDGSEVVFVGGCHLDDLKRYASTIEFT